MTKLDTDSQFGALTVLDYAIDLFTEVQRERYTREDVLKVLKTIRHDPDLFELDVLIAYDATMPRFEALEPPAQSDSLN